MSDYISTSDTLVEDDTSDDAEDEDTETENDSEIDESIFGNIAQ